MRAPLLLLALAGLGCAHSGLTVSWADAATLAHDPSKYPGAPAVILSRVDRAKLSLGDDAEAWTQWLRHEVIAVQNEAGFDLAEVRVPWRADGALVALQARVIQPDGAVQVVDPSSMLSDTRGTGERDVNAKFFRFPDVKVGSVLEYAYVIETPNIDTWDDQATLGSFPVKRYEFELTASKPITLEAKEYNASFPIDVRTLAEQQHQLHCEIRDLPQRKQADYAPHWTFTEPRWAFRVINFRWSRTSSMDVLRDWDDVVEGVAKKYFTDSAYTSGLDWKLERAGCGTRCLVERALELVRAKTEYRSAEWGRARPLKDVVESGTASITERVLLMRKLLEDAGLDARIAFGADRLSRQFDKDFPLYSQFNHLFLYVPKQGDLEGDVIVDPHCEFCEVNALTARHRDLDVLVTKATPAPLGSAVNVEAYWRNTAFASPAQPSEISRRHALKLDGEGNLFGETTITVSGLAAASHVRDKRALTTAQLERNISRELRSVHPLARAWNHRWGECDGRKGTCAWTTNRSLPRYATPEGPRLLVPLTALTTAWSTTFDEETRSLDVHFGWDDERLEEVLELTAPPGYVLVDPPLKRDAQVDGLGASLTVVKTENGARVVRSISRTMGAHPASEYAGLRATAAVFKDARQLVLTFEKR